MTRRKTKKKKEEERRGKEGGKTMINLSPILQEH